MRILLLSAFGGILIAAALSVAPHLFTLPEGRLGCDAPIHYRLGDVDGRFPLDRNAFLRTTLQAELVWERAFGKDLFVYDPDAPFVVTTVFDERQAMTYDARSLQLKLERYDERTGTLQETYDTLLSDFRRDQDKLNRRIATFEATLAGYNRDVRRANDAGGASEEDYEELGDRRKELEEEQSAIRAESERLGEVADRVNATAGTINTETETVKKNLSEYRQKYGEPQPFIQGLYESPLTSITIYQFEKQDDLRLVLAHEFGHALGIEEHVPDNPEAVMYAMMGGQDLEHPALTQDDIDSYRSACPTKTESVRDALVSHLVTTRWEDMRLSDILAILSR